jgi:hypothetical protein
MHRSLLIGIVLVATGSPMVVLAHQPIISDGTATAAEEAIFLDDIQISRVIYHEVTEDAPQVWLTFEIEEPQVLDLSLGVPKIDGLENFRPAFAIFGPGLPAFSGPIDAPQGLGGLFFSTDEVTEPEVFDEPFSCTSSWILDERQVDLPTAGRYYIVVFAPQADLGKLWIAPGIEEVFPLGEILALMRTTREVRAFHEVPLSRFLACMKQRRDRRD